MATFFGEVILPSSRVFFDDSDDDDESSPTGSSVLRVSDCQSEGLNFACDLLIIAEGNVARGFAEYHLSGGRAQLLAKISVSNPAETSGDDSGLQTRTRRSEPSVLYKVNDTTLLLDVSSSIDILLANNLTVLMESVLQRAKKILVLCTRSTADYRCESSNDLPSAFLRILKSSSWSDQVDQRVIEQPNFVSGLPASVVTWSEATGKPCLVVMCFADHDKPDAVTVNPFLNFFSSSNLSNLLLPVRGNISYKKTTLLDESNMYM